MRRKKQIFLSLGIAIVLLAVTWWVDLWRNTEATIQILAARCDIPAGSRIEADHLALISIPASLNRAGYLENQELAIGRWTTGFLAEGEFITTNRLHDRARGLSYPDAALGRRLITLKLEPAAANGFWLAAGNHIDLFLIPHSQDRESEMLILEQIRIMAVLDENTGHRLTDTHLATTTGRLICLDLNVEQAGLILGRLGSHDIRMAVVNENPTG
ncbi:MAG: Flp pilus assembly protein CpaB [Saccharofermentanales bacterium]|jgi:Flp pilus assembly protein CpaB